MLDLVLLRAFVAVADCGGFHRVAERPHLTRSAVSQQIKRLELETGRSLFRRTTRAVALTDDGEMLLGDVRRLLLLEEAARYRVTALRLSGMVRLGAVEEVAAIGHGNEGAQSPKSSMELIRAHDQTYYEISAAIGHGDKGAQQLEIQHLINPYPRSIIL
jgi:hypothetical protein